MDTKNAFFKNKPFVKIPLDLITEDYSNDNQFYLIVFYVVLMSETRQGECRFSKGMFIYDLLGYKKNKNKPTVALNTIMNALEKMRTDGYIEFIEDPYDAKMNELIVVNLLKRSNPSNEYVELYWDEFMAIIEMSKTTCDVSLNAILKFYLYIKFRTFGGKGNCTQSATSIGTNIGYSKDSSIMCVRLLCTETLEYTPLIIRNGEKNNESKTWFKLSLNSNFRKKGKNEDKDQQEDIWDVWLKKNTTFQLQNRE